MDSNQNSFFQRILQLPRLLQSKLVANMLVLLVPMVLIPVIVMGLTAFLQARSLLLQQATTQIAIYENKQSTNIEEWILSKHARFDNLARDLVIKNSIVEILETDNSDLKLTVLSSLNELNTTSTTYFNHLAFFDVNGTILVSSTDRWLNLNLTNSKLFNEHIAGRELHSFISYTPYPLFSNTENPESVDLKAYTITTTPLYDTDDTLLGYFIGVSEPFEIEEVLGQDNDALPKNTIYIINLDANSAKPTFESAINFSNKYGLRINTLNESQLNTISLGEYELGSIANEYTVGNADAVALYSVLSTDVLQAGLLIEVPSETVFAGVYELSQFATTLIIITAIISTGIIWLGSQRLTKPILSITSASRKFADGDWNERADVERTDEIGQLAGSFNSMANQLSVYYRELETEVSARADQLLTAFDVGNTATSAASLEEVLSHTVELLSERFGFYHSSVFLLDESKEVAILYEATGDAGQRLKREGFRMRLTGTSLIGWVVENNRPRIANDVNRDKIYLKNDLLSETRSEIVVPISIGREVLGVLDIQSKEEDSISEETASILLVIANQVAAAVQNFQLKAGTEIDLLQIRHLYRASRIIAQSTELDQIQRETANALAEIPFESALYIPKDNFLEIVIPANGTDAENPGSTTENLPYKYPKSIKISAESSRKLFTGGAPAIVRDLARPATPIRPILLEVARKQNFIEAAYIPMILNEELIGLIILGSKERNRISQSAIQPIVSFNELVIIAFEKVSALKNTEVALLELQTLNTISQALGRGESLESIYRVAHQEIKNIIGDITFFIALYNENTDHIEIPYIYEGGEQPRLEPFPLGEGLTSIVIRTQQPLMLVENTVERARALGAKIIGQAAKSWLGVPLIADGKVIGIMTAQDPDHEHRFTDADLALFTTVASQIAGVINNAVLLADSQSRALQLQTTAEIARDISGTFEQDELLRNAVNLIRDRFNFYHASVFLLDATEEYAVVRESTGDAGRQMKAESHKLAVGSQSIIGHVTAHKEPLVVDDITLTPTHRFNPLLPDTRAELGIPMMVGDRVIGALDVQSTTPYAFSSADIEILNILADLLAVAIANADLFSETQEHLAQHRLIHHVTTVAASSTNLSDALASAVQGLRVTLGDRVSILLLDPSSKILKIEAAAGYSDDIAGMTVEAGRGITGWVVEHREALLINDVLKDSRYIPGRDSVRSELAVPLTYRGEMLGVLNIESDSPGAFGQHDQDILGTLAGSLSAIIINARLLERQQVLFEITDKIRRATSMEKIMETTANELSRAMRTRRARIEISAATTPNTPETPVPAPQTNGKDEA